MSNIIPALTLAVTAIYAFLTYRIVKASKQQAEALFRPYVTITHRLSNKGLIRMYVRNSGKTVAENLRLEIDKSYLQIALEDYNIADHYAFKNILQSFPPESELVFALMPTITLKTQKSEAHQPHVFVITATYSYLKNVVVERTTIDLRIYDKTFMPDPTIQDRLEGLTAALVELNGKIERKPAE